MIVGVNLLRSESLGAYFCSSVRAVFSALRLEVILKRFCISLALPSPNNSSRFIDCSAIDGGIISESLSVITSSTNKSSGIFSVFVASAGSVVSTVSSTNKSIIASVSTVSVLGPFSICLFKISAVPSFNACIRLSLF